MVIVLFRSKLVANPEGYDAMSEEMNALARTMHGFVDARSFKSEDGERLNCRLVGGCRDAEPLARSRAPSCRPVPRSAAVVRVLPDGRCRSHSDEHIRSPVVGLVCRLK